MALRLTEGLGTTLFATTLDEPKHRCSLALPTTAPPFDVPGSRPRRRVRRRLLDDAACGKPFSREALWLSIEFTLFPISFPTSKVNFTASRSFTTEPMALAPQALNTAILPCALISKLRLSDARRLVFDNVYRRMATGPREGTLWCLTFEVSGRRRRGTRPA